MAGLGEIGAAIGIDAFQQVRRRFITGVTGKAEQAEARLGDDLEAGQGADRVAGLV